MARPIINQQRMLELLNYSSDNHISVTKDRCTLHVKIIPDKGGRPIVTFDAYYHVHWSTLFKLLMNKIIWAKPCSSGNWNSEEGWTRWMTCKIRR